MSDQDADRDTGGAGEDRDPRAGHEVDAAGSGDSGAGADDTGGSTADEPTPGSDGDGAEAGYTAPEDLVEDSERAGPTD